jgi:hypothetical protein
MKVVLVRKLADVIDGVDVSAYSAGDLVDLNPSDAGLLIAEQWAILDRRTSRAACAVERRHHSQSARRKDHEIIDWAS